MRTDGFRESLASHPHRIIFRFSIYTRSLKVQYSHVSYVHTKILTFAYILYIYMYIYACIHIHTHIYIYKIFYTFSLPWLNYSSSRPPRLAILRNFELSNYRPLRNPPLYYCTILLISYQYIGDENYDRLLTRIIIVV